MPCRRATPVPCIVASTLVQPRLPPITKLLRGAAELSTSETNVFALIVTPLRVRGCVHEDRLAGDKKSRRRRVGGHQTMRRASVARHSGKNWVTARLARNCHGPRREYDEEARAWYSFRVVPTFLFLREWGMDDRATGGEVREGM